MGLGGCLTVLLFAFTACRPSSDPPPRTSFSQRPATGKVLALDRFTPEAIGNPIGEDPWIAHVRAVDLDGDGRLDLIAAEARENTVLWLRQNETGGVEEHVLATDMRAPVHVEAVDMDGDGDLDIIVSSMGFVFPNNDRIGSVFILENDGEENFTPHLVAENIARVVDARAADFDQDGHLDLVLGQFGYDQGEVSWMRRVGPWEFEHHTLLNLSGTVNVCVADFDGDGRPDIAAAVSQQWEEVYVFLNRGNGRFETRRVFGSTNEDYSLSGMSVGDLNGDGRPDLIFSNGDGFGPSPKPGPKPWHGVQWLENTGNGFFRFHRIGDLGGAYSPIAVDLDRDGLMDVVALGSFNDWSKPNSEAIVWFRNDGNQRFTAHVLAHEPIFMITLDAGEFDDSGRPALFTGGFHAYPPYDRKSRLLIWRSGEEEP